LQPKRLGVNESPLMAPVGRSELRSIAFERILLVKPSSLGDVVHTIPVLAKLRRRYPAARIDWLLSPPIAELVGLHPALSSVVPQGRLFRLLRAIRRARYEMVIDLQGRLSSAALALASGASVRIGFDRPRRENWQGPRQRLSRGAYRRGWKGAREGSWIAYSHRIPIPTLDVHAVDRYLWVGPLLGLDDGPPEFHLPLPAGAESRVDGWLRGQGLDTKPFALLFPGARWETKRWSAAGFARVAEHCAESARGLVLAGAASERDLCREIAAACPGAVDLCGQTSLTELAALIRRAEICVTNDSGPMHLAVALGKPVVSVFGPTDPIWVGPYQRPQQVVAAGAPCAPCYLRKLSQCPHDHRCMTEVTARTVIDRMERTLSATTP
jgi:ADP-heptose:LPS heptosyltransferase